MMPLYKSSSSKRPSTPLSHDNNTKSQSLSVTASMTDAESDGTVRRRSAIPTSVGTGDNLYTILRDTRLGSGHFGDIYLGIHRSSGKKYAVKVEHGSRSVAKREWEVLKCLNGNGCPKIYYTCIYGDYFIMVMDLLGITLQKLLEKQPQRKLPWHHTVRKIATQCIQLLRTLHEKGYVHGDVKPENFLKPDSDTEEELYMIDFGLASRWRDLTRSSGHIAYKQKVDHFTGTIRYASTNAHFGRQLSRRDDLESLGYMLLFLVQGSLPWQGFTMPDKNMYVCEAKGKYSVDALCNGQPKVLKYLLAYTRQMKYEEKPDYDYLLMLCAEDGCERLDQLLAGEPLHIPSHGRDDKQEQHGMKRRFCTDSIGSNDNDDNNNNNNDNNTKRRLRPKYKNSVVEPQSMKLCQWIIASNTPGSSYSDAPGKQTFSSHTSYANLVRELEKKWAEGMRVALLNLAGNMWTVLLNEQSAYRSQTMNLIREISHEWLLERWSRKEFITSLAGNSVYWGIIMSSNTPYREQTYIISTMFPNKWVAKQWSSGYFITDLACQGDKFHRKWCIVMSRFHGNSNSSSDVYTNQVVEMDFKYPSQAIHARWNDGFIITNIAGSDTCCVFVLSKTRRNKKEEIEEEKQRCVRTSHNALDKIREEWNDGLYMKCLAYGRVK